MSEMWQSSKGGVIERGHVLNDPYQLKVPLRTPLLLYTPFTPPRTHLQPLAPPCTPLHPRTPPHHPLHPRTSPHHPPHHTASQSWAIEDMPTPADFAAAASDNAAASLSGKRSPDTASTNRLAGLASSSPGRGSSSMGSPRSPNLRGGGSAAAAGTKADELF